jgi:hypothetical protein
MPNVNLTQEEIDLIEFHLKNARRLEIDRFNGSRKVHFTRQDDIDWDKKLDAFWKDQDLMNSILRKMQESSNNKNKEVKNGEDNLFKERFFPMFRR